MRLHRFFTKEPILGNRIVVKDEHLLHQWRNVFRYNTGTTLVIFDGSGKEFEAVIEKISNREAELNLLGEKQGVVCSSGPTLYQSLIKKDKMEWVVEKATELGVAKIVPIVSERSEKKGFNLERARRIAIEASEQCGRADVPVVGEIISLDESLEQSGDLVIFDSSGKSLELKAKSSKLKPLSLFIGPEGGWSEKELKFFRENNAEIFSLGKLTLRAETAAVVTLGLITHPLSPGGE